MLISSGPLLALLAVLGFDAPPGASGSDSVWGDASVIALDGGPLGVQMVEIDRETWRALQPPAPEPEILPPPWPAAREVRVRPEAGGYRVEAAWTLRSLDPGWFDAHLMPVGTETRNIEVTIDGRPASPAIVSGPQGDELHLAVRVDGVSRIGLRYFVAHDDARGPLPLELMEAVRSTAAVTGGDFRWLDPAGQALTPVDGKVWETGALTLAPGAEPPPAATGRLASATVGIGITVGEAETRTRARVQWAVRRGELERVRLRVAGTGRDLQVEGPNVRSWNRSGDTIDVELSSPARDRVALDLHWSTPTPTGTEGRSSVPTFVIEDAYRVEGAVQVARDGEVEVLPELLGWTPRASSQLPTWAEGLVAGTPTAAFVGEPRRGGDLALLRFEPVQGPPVLVDIADYELALSQEGRLIGQARYEVRNDRGATLRIEPPPGLEIIGVRVGGEVVAPGRDAARGEGEAWLIPLRRSVETVDGLISFPVEVALLGAPEAAVDAGFDERRRVRDELPLPVLDAPVAAQRVTLHLPPRFRSEIEAGERGVVAGFSEGEGITYGFASGDDRGEQADALFQSAVEDWLDNDFSGAQDKLDELSALGADNANVARLQSNLDLVLVPEEPSTSIITETVPTGGEDEATGISLAGTTGAEYELEGQNISDADEADRKVASKKRSVSKDAQQAVVARRVRQQARARAGKQKVKMKNKADEARQLRSEGRYREAESAYGEALALGNELAALEDEESMEQAFDNRQIAEEIQAIQREEAQRERVQNLGNVAPSRDFDSTVDLAPAKGGVVGGTLAGDGEGKLEGKKTEPRADEPVEAAHAAPKTPDTVTVYDFEDDDIEGELLRPEGANLASRSRSSANDLVDDVIDQPMQGLEKTLEMPLAGPSSTTTDTTSVVDEAGEGVSSMDEDAFLEEEKEYMELDADEPEPMARPTAAEDVERVRVFGRASGRSRGAGFGGGGGLRTKFANKSRGRAKKSKSAPAPAGSAASTPAASPPPPPADPNAALEGPQVTASGLALMIPTVGEAVLYQQLLIPAGGRPTLVIDARRERRRRGR